MHHHPGFTPVAGMHGSFAMAHVGMLDPISMGNAIGLGQLGIMGTHTMLSHPMMSTHDGLLLGHQGLLGHHTMLRLQGDQKR